MLRQRHGDHLVALFLEAHDDHALSGPVCGLLDVLHRRPDQDTGLGHQQQVLGAVHHLDAYDLAGLVCDLVVLDAQTAPVGDAVLLHRRPLAVALLRDGQHALALSGSGSAYHIVALPETDAPDAHSRAAHRPDVILVEHHGHAVMGGNEDLLAAVGLPDRYQLVALVHGQRPDTVVAEVLQRLHRQTLHRTVPGHHHQIELLLAGLPVVKHGLHPLTLLDLQNVDEVGALGGLAGLGDLIALLPVDFTGIGKEQDMIVGRSGKHIHHRILFPGGDALFAHAALGLSGILADGGPLDVARLRQSKDALLLLNEVLNVDLVLHVLNLGLAVIAELFGNGGQFFLQDLTHQTFVGQHPVEVSDPLLQLLVLALQLLPVQALQRLQAHIQNGLCLNIVQTEALHELLLGIVISAADNLDDLIDVILRDQQTLQQMSPLLRLFQIVAGPADDDFLLERQIFVNDVPQGQDLGLVLVIHQSQHIDGKRSL